MGSAQEGQLLGSDPLMAPLLGESMALTCPKPARCAPRLCSPHLPREGPRKALCVLGGDNSDWRLLATPELSPQVF